MTVHFFEKSWCNWKPFWRTTMVKQLLYISAVVSVVMSWVGCTQQAADPRQASLDNFCKQFPLSASCPEGKNVIAKQNAFCAEFPLSVTCPDGRQAIQKQNAFCSQFPMSASCPKGKAAMEKKTRWCTDFPKSAVCSWAAQPITLHLSQYDWLRHTSPKSILTILIFLVSIRLK